MDDEKSLCLFLWITSREKFFSISANSNHELLPCKTLIFDKITNQSTPFYVKFKTSSLHVLRKVLSARQLFFLKSANWKPHPKALYFSAWCTQVQNESLSSKNYFTEGFFINFHLQNPYHCKNCIWPLSIDNGQGLFTYTIVDYGVYTSFGYHSYFSSTNLKILYGYQRYQKTSPTCKVSERLVWNRGK